MIVSGFALINYDFIEILIKTNDCNRAESYERKTLLLTDIGSKLFLVAVQECGCIPHTKNNIFRLTILT